VEDKDANQEALEQVGLIDCASKMRAGQAQFFHDSAFIGTLLRRLFNLSSL
jgi:hypothetical protein